MRRCRSALVGLVCCLLIVPASADASSHQVSILQDDAQLIYAAPSRVAATLRQLASLGVDEVKASLVWGLVAPNPRSRRIPRFDARDPAAYPPGAWTRYDMLVRMASALGMRVYLEISPIDPAWAAAPGLARGQGPILGQAPDPQLLEAFVEAAGRRYGGGYVDRVPAQEPSAAALGVRSAPQASTASAIPRVAMWGIWNEPNEVPWLSPWFRRLPHHGRALLEPALYRGIVDAAWRGLRASGHDPAHDTILFGELANRGTLSPAGFVRALYCIGPRGRILRGVAASAVQCPPSGDRGRFLARHPALFDASGVAHHPYGFGVAPDRRYHDPSWVTLADMGAFKRVIDQGLSAYGRARRGGMAIYLTEWGYKTEPPNPFAGTSLAEQQAWLDQGDYLAWRLFYVRSIAQFLLRDTGPKTGERRGSRAYWSTFQTGLEYGNGTPKPAYGSYRLPIWLPHAHHGRAVEVWGQVRNSGHGAGQAVAIEFRARGRAAWTLTDAVRVREREGFFDVRVALPGAGAVRLGRYSSRLGRVIYSRVVAVA